MNNLENNLYKSKEINRLQLKREKLLYDIAEIQDDIELLEEKVKKIEIKVSTFEQKANDNKAYYGTKSIDELVIKRYKKNIKDLLKLRENVEEELNFIIEKLNKANS